MHPAFSVIFFTVTSGAGYGLIALLCLLNFLYFGMLLDKSTFDIFVSKLTNKDKASTTKFSENQ